MKLTVFGATGGIGGHIVRQALDQGHSVTAVLRGRSALDLRHPALDVVTVRDLTDPEALRPAVQGRAAVLSGVGPRGRHDGPVATDATRSIVRAMEAEEVRRLVTVSATPAGEIPEGDSFVNRRVVYPAIGALLKDLYADLRTMEQDLAASSLDWTAVRPPKLLDTSPKWRYRTVAGGNVPRGYYICRADVAHAMLAAVNDPATFRQPVGVAY